MQIGEQNLARPHAVELGTERLLDLEDEIGAFPDRVRAFDDGGAGRLKGFVRNRAADPRPGFDDDFVPVRDKSRNA